MGILAIFVMLATLLAIDGMATLSIIEGNGTDASESYGRINASTMNITVLSSGTWDDDLPVLANIAECNATISNKDNMYGGNNSVAIILASDATGTVNWINISGLNFTDTVAAYGYDTLTDGRYRLVDVVCLNLTGGDTDNSTEIAQDLYFDFTDASEAVMRTTDKKLFESKKTVAINATVNSVQNTSNCVYFFEGGKKPGNQAVWTFVVNETSLECTAAWNTTDLTDGVYRYTVAGYDGLNISNNYSANTASTVFREFQIKESTMSPLLKAQALKDAGYDELETADGTLNLGSLALFGEEGGVTSSSNMFALLVIGIFVYLLVFYKKKK